MITTNIIVCKFIKHEDGQYDIVPSMPLIVQTLRTDCRTDGANRFEMTCYALDDIKVGTPIFINDCIYVVNSRVYNTATNTIACSGIDLLAWGYADNTFEFPRDGQIRVVNALEMCLERFDFGTFFEYDIPDEFIDMYINIKSRNVDGATLYSMIVNAVGSLRVYATLTFDHLTLHIDTGDTGVYNIAAFDAQVNETPMLKRRMAVYVSDQRVYSNTASGDDPVQGYYQPFTGFAPTDKESFLSNVNAPQTVSDDDLYDRFSGIDIADTAKCSSLLRYHALSDANPAMQNIPSTFVSVAYAKIPIEIYTPHQLSMTCMALDEEDISYTISNVNGGLRVTPSQKIPIAYRLLYTDNQSDSGSASDWTYTDYVYVSDLWAAVYDGQSQIAQVLQSETEVEVLDEQSKSDKYSLGSKTIMRIDNYAYVARLVQRVREFGESGVRGYSFYSISSAKISESFAKVGGDNIAPNYGTEVEEGGQWYKSLGSDANMIVLDTRNNIPLVMTGVMVAFVSDRIFDIDKVDLMDAAGNVIAGNITLKKYSLGNRVYQYVAYATGELTTSGNSFAFSIGSHTDNIRICAPIIMIGDYMLVDAGRTGYYKEPEKLHIRY